MNRDELVEAKNKLRACRNSIDLALDHINELLYQMDDQDDYTECLARLEGWAEMEKYMSGRKQ